MRELSSRLRNTAEMADAVENSNGSSLLCDAADEIDRLSAPIEVARGKMRMKLDPAHRDVVDFHIGALMERTQKAEREKDRLRKAIEMMLETKNESGFNTGRLDTCYAIAREALKERR